MAQEYEEEEDDFAFTTLETTEDMSRYEPGGYHPLHIGSIVQSPKGPSSSYRIIHKLGYGSSATVWLAQKINASLKYVALKVSTATGTSINEAEFMGRVSSPHTAPLLDAFPLEGPNGLHLVIVTEVLLPILSSSSWSARGLKKVAYDLARAVAELHKSGCVHGDLHLGNVGISIPQMANQELTDVMQDLGDPALHPVLPMNFRKASPSLPVYVVPPCKIGNLFNRIVEQDFLPEVKLFDFGSAHAVGEIPATLQCAYEACSPEIVFACHIEKVKSPPVEPPSDVWALGAMIYEVIVGSSLFWRPSMATLLNNMSLMATNPPVHWDGRWCPPVVDTNDWWSESWRRNMLISRCSSEADTEALIRMLKKIFILDPLKRPSAEEICQDDWFAELR